MVVGLTHSSFKRLASEPNGTVITPGRSDAFPYRFQEVAVATTISTYTCMISSQPRSSQVHHVSQTPSTRVGRTSYRICRLHSQSSATHNTYIPFYFPLARFVLSPTAKRTLRPSSSKKKFRKTNLPLRGMRNAQKNL